MRYWKTKQIPANDYYAVIFVYTRGKDLEGYAEMDKLTIQLAEKAEGYLGHEVVSNENEGIFISYWISEDAIARWRDDLTHLEAKRMGKAKWYNRYLSQVCLVQRGHEFIR